MKSDVESFLSQFPEFERARTREQVEIFAFFLTEVAGDQAIKPKRIRECYETARLNPPANISDVIGKSGSFVPSKAGLQLLRSVRNSIAERLAADRVAAAYPTGPPVAAPSAARAPSDPQNAGEEAPKADPVPGITRNVMVVYGRNQGIRDSMFSFLRALKLNPIEWIEAVAATGNPSPYVGEILDAAFKMAQAVVVVLTPDEHVQLQRELCSSDEEFSNEEGFQPRPNVLLEAGMALARAERRTLLVQVGDVRIPSDIHGRHLAKLDDSVEKRNGIAQRLRIAGCDPDTSRDDWYRAGTFQIAAKRKRNGK